MRLHVSMCPCVYGHMDTWTHGHMNTWSHVFMEQNIRKKRNILYVHTQTHCTYTNTLYVQTQCVNTYKKLKNTGVETPN